MKRTKYYAIRMHKVDSPFLVAVFHLPHPVVALSALEVRCSPVKVKQWLNMSRKESGSHAVVRLVSQAKRLLHSKVQVT